MAGTVDAPPDLLRVVTAPNPSPFTLDGTNTYVLGRGQVVVIDPGPEVAEHVEAVLETAGQAGRVALIVVTHSHRDHTGAVSPLVAATGAPVRQWGRGRGLLRTGRSSRPGARPSGSSTPRGTPPTTWPSTGKRSGSCSPGTSSWAGGPWSWPRPPGPWRTTSAPSTGWLTWISG